LLREPFPEALEIMLGVLARRGSGNRMDFETPRIQNPSQTPDDAAFAGCIPSFEYDDSALRGPEVSLLDHLQFVLQ
jgi:hypothetical protein